MNRTFNNPPPGEDDWLEGTSPFALPPGLWPAVLQAIEDRVGTFGPCIRWVFMPLHLDATLGAPADFSVSRITSRKFADGPSGPSKANEIVAALIGHRLRAGEGIRKGDLIGKPCLVVLDVNENGYNVVERVLPAERPASAPKPSASALKPERAPEPVDPSDEDWADADSPF